MAKANAGSVFVEIALDKTQFDKDMKAAGRELAAMQKSLSLEMERNKVKFAVEGVDKGWADKMFGSTVVGKIAAARKETELLNKQIGLQQNKVDLASGGWQALIKSKGAMSGAAAAAEKSFMREQMALVGLKTQLDGATSASAIMGGAMATAATTAAAAVAALAAAYATGVSAAVAWGQAVNDIVDETGMADQEAARLMGTMNIVGISAEEAAGAIAKLSKNVTAAAKAQGAAAKAGVDSEDVFTRFGIAIKGSDGQLLQHDEIVANIIGVHREMQDGLQKTAMEMEIFGKTGYKMNDLLNLSKEQIDDYRNRIDRLGLSIKDSAKYEDFNRQLAEMKLAFQGIAITIVGDDIPALTQMIAKTTEFSAWIHENKAGLDDFKESLLLIGSTVFKPFTIGMELTIAGLKKYVESVNVAAKAGKELHGESTLADIPAAAKMAENIAKKEKDLARQKIADAKEMQKAEGELQIAILALQGQTLAVTLANIETEKKAWQKKVGDEVAATKWAEAAKTKAYKDALDARLGPEVAAAKQAILDGTNVQAAIRQASDARVKDERATFDAKSAVRSFYGIQQPGDVKSTLIVDGLAQSITQLREVLTQVGPDYAANARKVFEPYNGGANINDPNPFKGQASSIHINNVVNVAGMDAESAGQMTEQIAGRLIPVVQQAVGGSATTYGGGK